MVCLSGCSGEVSEQAPPADNPPPLGWNASEGLPVLAAHYMPWFNNPHTSQRQLPKGWVHWQWSQGDVHHDPDVRLDDTRRDIASTQYPLIGPYSSDNASVVRYHMRTAKAAGIDAFIVIWYGPGSETDALIPMILDMAEETGLKVAICYEEKLNWPAYRQPESRDDIVASATRDIAYILDEYTGHPAYLTRNGEPVIVQFNYWGDDEMGPRTILPDEWEKILGAQSRPVIYVRQNLNPEYHPILEGNYVWWTKDTSYLEDFADYSRTMIDKGDLEFFMSMIAPGFDDSGVGGWGKGNRTVPSEGLSILKDTFDRAWRGNPEIIQIVTWNDFNEGTAVEPTLDQGYRYLDAIETWWGERTGRPVDLEDNRLAFADYLEQATPAQMAEVNDAAIEVSTGPSNLEVSHPNYLESLP